MAKKIPNKIDVTVGERIRIARLEARMTQTELAATLGVTFQQLQKYEIAANRCAPSKLLLIAGATSKPISWFYDETEKPPGADLMTEMLTTPHGVALAVAFLSIKKNADRVTVVDVATAFGAH